MATLLTGSVGELLSHYFEPILDARGDYHSFLHSRNALFVSQGIPAPHADTDLFAQKNRHGKVYTQANLRHIADGLRGKTTEEVQEWLENSVCLERRLVGKTHTYRASDDILGISEASDLTPLQRLRCHIMLDALANPAVVRQVKDLIALNPKDGKTEFNGFFLYNRTGGHEFELYQTPFYLRGKSQPADQSCHMHLVSQREQPHIALFHLHALYDDCSKYAGPSFSETFKPSDITSCIDEAREVGESHNFVITALGGDEFNVDYYGAELRVLKDDGRLVSTEIRGATLDLGNY